MPWVLPILHPASIFRGQWPQEPAQVSYLERAKLLLEGEWHPADVEALPPQSYQWPTLDTLASYDGLIQLGSWNALAVDIENAGHYITLLGLTLMDLKQELVGPSLSLPFRVRYGHRYWASWQAHERATSYLFRWLADERLAKVFHNGITHDVPILEDNGFKVRGPLWDTMVMAHHTYPEMPKGLSYCSTLYLGLSNWKVLLTEEDEDDGKA